MELEPGSHLGPYEIVAAIGAGGMGEVYRARDTRLGREIAIKVLPRELIGDPARLARFQREARSASALNHRNIVTVHDFASSDGESWLVMELVKGESLRALLTRGALPLNRAVDIAAGVAAGLAAAHDAGLVHRDIKPENIMIALDGTPKILDFGLVKNAEAPTATAPTELQVSHTGAVFGTATYMSPEQARGETVDFRTDQFSFGLVLYEMITGRHPFARTTPIETLAAILKDEPPPLPATVPERLSSIVERCLSGDVGGRYGSTADLAHDLASLRNTDGRRVERHAARSGTRGTWMTLVIALAAAAAMAIVFALRPRDGEPADVALSVDIATPFLASVLLDETGEPVSISPNGEHLLITGVGTNAVDGVWIRNLHTGESRLLADKGKLPAWSPDSRMVAFFADGKLKTVSIDGGPARIICDARAEGLPVWAGDHIIFGQYSAKERGLYRVPARGGAPVLMSSARVSSGSFSPQWWPQLLPDGEHLLYLRFALNPAARTIAHLVMVSDADGRNEKQIGNFSSRPLYVQGHVLYVRDGTLLAHRFDLDKLELQGEPRPLLSGLHYFRSTGSAAFSASQTGILAWRSARGRSRLVWMDRSGIEGETIASAEFLPDGRLSPDGTRYATGVLEPNQGVSDVWVYDMARHTAERLTFTQLDEKAPVWQPDGQTLAYRSDGGGGPPDIFHLVPGTDSRDLVHTGWGVEEPHDISADGRLMLFVDYFSTGTDINLLPLDGSGPPRPFVATPFSETSPRFSPDGQWVAYESDVSGTAEVYVRSLSDPPVTTRVSASGGRRPRWNRNGRELFFLGANGRLMSAAMNDGAPSAPRMLFQAVEIADFEPAADGSRFVVQLRESSTDTAVHLLISWPALLARRD